MRNYIVSRTLVLGLSLTAIFAVASGSTVWASAPLQAAKVFTPQSPYYEKVDRNGKFTGQVNYGSSQRLKPMAWSFQTTPAIRAIASSPMVCSAGHFQLPYHDVHPGIPTDYLWHSTVSNNHFNKSYVMWGVCKFTVNVGGRTGHARLDFRFSYRVNHGPRVAMLDVEQRGQAPDEEGPEDDMVAEAGSLDSSLAIRLDDPAGSGGGDRLEDRLGRGPERRVRLHDAWPERSALPSPRASAGNGSARIASGFVASQDLARTPSAREQRDLARDPVVHDGAGEALGSHGVLRRAAAG